ncbi:MAG: helix-turn-helix transcriptional regulator [Lutibacter sp.]|jgi:DNA-binding CsgD family transcriptional regulator|nr:helix-turn-helix transcriptional regulator [Lutibacter sp.]
MTKVFGTEMLLITSIIIAIQALIVAHQIVIILSVPKDKNAQRYLLLICFYLFYNIASGLFPDPAITMISVYWQTILAYFSGLSFSMYYLYFINHQYHLEIFNRNKIHFLILLLLLSFVLLFVLPYSYTYEALPSIRKFLCFPICLEVYFIAKILRQLRKNYTARCVVGDYYYFRHVNLYLSLISFIAFPLVVFAGDYQSVEQPLANLGFFSLSINEVSRRIRKRRRERRILQQFADSEFKQGLKNLELTPKELEIAQLILESYKYSDIADRLFITEKTVGKHASNIYKKANITNKQTFIEKYKSW